MTFTYDLFQKFVFEYAKALNNQKNQFKFEGHDVLTNFAKYVIEYYGPKFEKLKLQNESK
jgi:hypothetical protein